MIKTILKSLLSLFGIVGRASQEQSAESLQKLKKAIEKRVKNHEDYQVVFGYGLHSGLMSTKISCYAIGFSQRDGSLAVVPIYEDSDEIEDLIFFAGDEIKSITTGMQGEKILKSDSIKGDFRFTVPYFTNENAGDMFQLPIVQMEAAAAFEKWVKENY